MRPSRFILPLVGVVLGLGACGGARAPSAGVQPHSGRSAGVAGAGLHPAQPQAPSAATIRATPLPPGITEVATLTTVAPASRVPDGPPVASVPQSWYGYPSVLPVIARQPGWIEVREAQRPNESTAWIPQADATIGTTAYRLVLHLATMHLQELRDGQQVADFPAGIGTSITPTTEGQFFVTMKAPPPSAGYGPFALVTSDHSNAITDWDASGDAITAIHGPITAAADRAIGTTGAAVSNGCVRLHDSDLSALADIPPGTPFDVEA